MTRRLRGGWVRRYRVCQREECAEKWTTLEIPEGKVDTEGTTPDLMREIILRRDTDGG